MLLALATMRRSLQWGSVYCASLCGNLMNTYCRSICSMSCRETFYFNFICTDYHSSFQYEVLLQFDCHFWTFVWLCCSNEYSFFWIRSWYRLLFSHSQWPYWWQNQHLLYQFLDGPDKRNTVISSYYKLGLWFKVGGFYWALLLGWQLSAYEFL